MDGFISKPFDVSELVSLIRQLLDNPGKVKQSLAQENNAAADNDELQGFDPKASPDFSIGLKFWKEDKVFKRYLARFVDTYQNSLDLVLDLPRKDAAVLVHKIKGVAANMGLENLSFVCGVAEDQLCNKDKKAEQTLKLTKLTLKHALNEIQRYLASEGVAASTVASSNFHAPTVSRICQQMLEVIDDDDLDQAADLLLKLEKQLVTEQLQPLRRAIDDFDLAAVKKSVEKLVEVLALENRDETENVINH